MHAKHWNVEVYVSEEGDETHARAVLVGDSPRQLSASGTARRNPHDPQVPEVGDEVAVGRALTALGHELLHTASRDIAVLTEQL